MMIGPFYKYKLLIEKNFLKPDNDQEKFIKTIDNLYKDLQQYQNYKQAKAINKRQLVQLWLFLKEA